MAFGFTNPSIHSVSAVRAQFKTERGWNFSVIELRFADADGNSECAEIYFASGSEDYARQVAAAINRIAPPEQTAEAAE